MKNFRKSIIALATAAAMLIPSVAMAATTFTTEVESSKIVDSDNVYVGFYENKVLKEVVKTTVNDVKVKDEKLQGEEDLPVTVTVENEEVGERSSDGEMIYKLVFKTTVPEDAEINSTGLVFSYDNTKIQPVIKTTKKTDVNPTHGATTKTPFEGYYVEEAEENFELKVKWIDTEAGTGVKVDSYSSDYVMDNTIDEPQVFLEFYYRVLNGATLDADTFSIPTEYEGTVLSGAYANKEGTTTAGIAIGEYRYGWTKTDTTDTISFGGFPFAPAGPDMTTLTVSTEKNVDGYKAVMFIWDADQIAKVAPIALN